MKRKKRILLFVLMIVFGSVLAACGSSPSTETPSMADKTEAVPEAQLTEKTGNSESTEFTEEQAKTVIPFCTSSSDDIGNSLHIFSELCPDAEIAEGLTANDLNDIEPWIQRLGLIP